LADVFCFFLADDPDVDADADVATCGVGADRTFGAAAVAVVLFTLDEGFQTGVGFPITVVEVESCAAAAAEVGSWLTIVRSCRNLQVVPLEQCPMSRKEKQAPPSGTCSSGC
jgi:hypothetical protein